MAYLASHWRVYIASIIALVFIIGAFALTNNSPFAPIVEASTEAALLQAIASKDSDGDGLTDWEEALYGTSPTVTDTNNLGMTDGDAVAKGLIVPKAIADIKTTTSDSSATPTDGSLPSAPAEGTLTDAFARQFFSLYLAAKESNGGLDLSENATADLVNKALESLSTTVVLAPDFKSANDLKTSLMSADALRMFAAEAEAVLLQNTNNTPTTELLDLQNAIENNDVEALAHLVSRAKTYRDAAVGLSALSVPKELVEGHLTFINALMRVSGIVSDFARVNDDPLTTMFALQQYLSTTEDITKGLVTLGSVYVAAGVTLLPEGERGSQFIKNIVTLTEKWQAAANGL